MMWREPSTIRFGAAFTGAGINNSGSILTKLPLLLGISPASGGKQAAGLRVGHIMRRNGAVISNRAPFDEVLKALGRSPYDRLPVVNDQEELVGVIKYTDIANTLFDPSRRHLIVADDIASAVHL